MYRHDTHTQALMVMNCDAVVAVAPASLDFSDPADLDEIRAFVLHPLDCLVLHRGTWHWGPFPIGPDPVRLLNVQGRRYAEDNASVDLPGAPAARSRWRFRSRDRGRRADCTTRSRGSSRRTRTRRTASCGTSIRPSSTRIGSCGL